MKVLFLHNVNFQLAPYIKRDYEILSAHHECKDFLWRAHPEDILRVGRDVSWCDLVFCWFASIYNLYPLTVARLLGRPVVVVAGGYEVACEPEIGYGNMREGPKRWLGRQVFRLSHLVLAVSSINKEEALQNAGVPASKVRLIHHGFDGEQFKPAEEKQDFVVTVGAIRQGNIKKKGLELVVRTASLMPRVRFAIVGAWVDESVEFLRKLAGPNVEFTRHISYEELPSILGSAKVYVQPSVHESFGCSVAEAMLCGCVPVVSRRAALPEVVGEAGEYTEALEPAALADAISRAFASGGGAAARERILREFPLSRRREALLRAVAEFER